MAEGTDLAFQSEDKIRELVEGWLARARNPSSRMEAQLKAAEERIKQLEHEKIEEAKGAEIKQQEHKIQVDKYEKVIMMMATELKNIQEGKEPQIADERKKALEAVEEEVEKVKVEKEDLENMLKDVKNNLVKAEETIKTLTKW